MAESSRACLLAIRNLQSLISRQYRNGGWLPPGRRLAQELGICHRTYSKALHALMAEYLVTSYRGKGYYVFAENLRPRKIGMVLRAGGDSPYIDEISFFAQALLALKRERFLAHVIQASRAEKIVDGAIARGVEGLLWFAPPKQTWALIRKIQEADVFPIVVVQALDEQSAVRPLYEVAYSSEYGRRANLRAMMARGHRNILYLGNHDAAEPHGLGAEVCVMDGSSRPEDRCVDASRQPGWITQRLLKGDISAIITPGDICSMQTLFQEVAALPEERRPEILVPEQATFHALYRKHPQLGILVFRRELREDFGAAAAAILTGHLTGKAPLRSAIIGYDSEELVRFRDLG